MERKRQASNYTVKNIVITALVMALICVATMIIKIPVPMTEGYVHLGDAMIFLGVLILGKNQGALAAGVGSALGDLIGGYPAWIPWTLGIKFIMAFLMGLVIEKSISKQAFIKIFAMIIGGIEMVAGYYLAASIMYSNWIVPIGSIPWNIGQFVMGIILAVLLAAMLENTPIGAQMKYRIGFTFKNHSTGSSTDSRTN